MDFETIAWWTDRIAVIVAAGFIVYVAYVMGTAPDRPAVTPKEIVKCTPNADGTVYNCVLL